MTDPAAYFLPEAAQLAAQGNARAAADLLTVGLKATPNNGQLLAQRALIQLEAASGKASPELVKAVRADASAAAKDDKAAAESAYVLGLLEENQGQPVKAEEMFRQALKNHRGDNESSSRIRIALARVLQLDRPAAVAPVEPKGKDDKKDPDLKGKDDKKDPDLKGKDDKKDPDLKGKDDKKDVKGKDDKKKDVKGKDDKKAPDAKDKDDGEVSLDQRLEELIVLALLGVQPGLDDDEDPALTKRLQESIELAKELIKSANPKTKGQGYMLLGQAMAKQGKRTEGLREYAKGLELVFPGMPTKDMNTLIEEHPAFLHPDVTKQPNPFLAEQFYGKGLHLYWEKKYPEAEKLFLQAVRYFSDDARYQYFLGLSQLAQKTVLKRDAAYFSFEKGARLEAANRPLLSEINASLERIQGPLRQQLNTWRQKAVETAAP